VEPAFAPALSVARLWKRIPLKLAVVVTLGLLVLLLGALSWNSMRESVRQRASVLVEDYFSSGIGRWTSEAAGWTRDPAGFVQVGSLALLIPSLRMQDYRLEFMGEIEQQSLAWVFRAQDLDSYYAMKIAVLQPGPLPSLALVRSRVLHGQQTPLGQVPIRVFLHSAAPFRVQMRVVGNDFTTFINNEQVDFWTDDRLASGGVGFFCEKEGRARLYWVKVSHQDDLLGKLCSFLAPNDVSRNGSRK
jgi:hypothetical protein